MKIAASFIPLAALLWWLWIGFKPDTNLAGGLWGMVAVAATALAAAGWLVVFAVTALASLWSGAISLADCVVAANLLFFIPPLLWLQLTAMFGR